MLFFTGASTKHVASDDGRTYRCACRYSIAKTYRHRRVSFHAAYLSTAINGAAYSTVANDDMCIAIGIIGIQACAIHSHHSLLAIIVVGLTLAAAEHVACDGDLFSAFSNCCI